MRKYAKYIYRDFFFPIKLMCDVLGHFLLSAKHSTKCGCGIQSLSLNNLKKLDLLSTSAAVLITLTGMGNKIPL